MYRKYFTRDNSILLSLMAVKVFIQYLLIHPVYDLQRDEYLHLDQANHPAWGYISVPPFTSWIAMIIKVLGSDVFWVKFFPALFGAFTLFLAWKIVDTLKGDLFAKILVSLAILFSSILRINILFQPNSFEVLSWTAFYLYLIRFIQTKTNRLLYILAIIIALSFLNKYNIIFMIAGLIPAIILSQHRELFKNRHLYFSLLFCLLLITPNLLWQVQHDFPVVHHMKTLARTQLVNFGRLGFIKDQLLFFINAVFIIIAAFFAFFRYRPFQDFRFLGWAYLFTIALYIYMHAKSYYAIGLYPVLLAFGAVYLEHLTREKKRYIYRGIMIVILFLLFIPMMQVAFPNKSPEQIAANPEPYRRLGLLRWEDGRDHDLPQDFADMLGWRELAYKVDSVYNTLPDKKSILVLCDNYGQAGAINYYSINKLRAVSFNADYINWFPYGQPIKHAILVKDLDDDDPQRNREIALCDTLWKSGEITNPDAREKGASIFVMKHINVDVWPRILEEIRKVKAE